jgi:hypothetical protein
VLTFVALEDTDDDIHLPTAVNAKVAGGLPQVWRRNLVGFDPTANRQL